MFLVREIHELIFFLLLQALSSRFILLLIFNLCNYTWMLRWYPWASLACVMASERISTTSFSKVLCSYLFRFKISSRLEFWGFFFFKFSSFVLDYNLGMSELKANAETILLVWLISVDFVQFSWRPMPLFMFSLMN